MDNKFKQNSEVIVNTVPSIINGTSRHKISKYNIDDIENNIN